jgi:exodeoxyribonuclease V beta subunit
VVAGIQQLLGGAATIGGRSVSPSDIAVLVRQNDEGAAIQQALREAGIPAVISKSGDIWSAPEVADLEHLLRAFLRPSDRTSLCSALATDLWGKNATAVQAIQQDEEALENVRSLLNEVHTTWRRHGVLRAVMQFVEELSVTERLLSLIDGERRLTNLRHALELLHQEESRHNRGPDELLQWLRTREARRAEDREMAELRLESDERAVQIVTIHKSKGLQYNIVIAPFLWSANKTHDSSSNVLVHDGAAIVYDVGSTVAEERWRIADAERLAEDLRLAYVALTRAVHRCYVVWGEINLAERSAAAYLLHGHTAASHVDVAGRAAAAFEASGSRAARVRAALDGLVSSHRHLMTIVDLPADGPDVRRVSPSGDAFAPRVLSEDVLRQLVPWRISSYSQLASGEPHEAAFASRNDEARRDFFAFATGRVAGSCLHEIIEEVDLSALQRMNGRAVPPVKQLVERKLRAFGLDDPAAHRGGEAFDPHREVIELLRRMGSTPLPLAGVALPALDPRRMLREWSFMVPVDTITPRALADAVARYAPEPIRRDYPKRLQHLDQEAMNGYLTGIADLAFEHERRWYVLDWKSTHLGSRWEDYASERLVEAALERHYILQLLIYALGLHRYLQTRMPDYDYERHIGGAGVVFLRGIDGASERGFFTMRPPLELIWAMDEMLKPVPA